MITSCSDFKILFYFFDDLEGSYLHTEITYSKFVTMPALRHNISVFIMQVSMAMTSHLISLL